MSCTVFKVFKKIVEECILKFPEIDKIYLTGSQVESFEKDTLSQVFDIDLIIFFSTNFIPQGIIPFFAKATAELNIIIHPLLISENEKELKLGIIEYKSAVQNGILLYNKNS